ncbi:E3 ubiquitin-protein ligase RAD18 [Anthophora quadrimaculata]
MWPQEYVELKRIEDLLVCGICYEFMDTSVITSCSHNYCSLCIRKYLHYKTQCPACFTETFEKDLRKNKVLDEIISQFSQIKDKLKRCLQIQIQFAPCDKVDNVSKTQKLLHQNKDEHENKEEDKMICNTSIARINASPSINLQTDICSPSTSGRPRIPMMFTPKSTKRPTVTHTEDTKVVICPVCKVTVSETNINRHLDDCLKRESMKDRQQVVKLDRKPLPKLVFTLMKDAVIRKKLKEFGLSSQGDRRVMETRLQRYIVLYNAECDKSNPRSISELVKQCEDEENLEKKINKTSFLNKLQITRNTEQNVIENERKKYLETHKDSFENLIKKIKSIDTPKKSSVRRSLLKESIENNEDIPHKRQAVTENLDDSMIDVKHSAIQSPNSAVYIQDSDSDTSCPLQMYSSTDPQKFLNIELSPSNNNDSYNKSEINYEGHNNAQEFKSSNLNIKINETEEHDSSDALSDTSISSVQTQPISETSFYSDRLKEDYPNLSSTSKYKKLLQRKKNLSLKSEMKWMETVTTSMKDFDCDSTVNEEEEEDEKPTPVLQDILCDLSSNDSTDSNLKYGNFHGFVNDSVTKSSNLEKENINSIPERSGNYSIRKRTRDSTQNDKFISNMKKKVRKSPHYQTETKELNKGECSNTLNDEEMGCLQNQPQVRKRLSKIVKDTTVVRKSSRKRVKNNE